MSPSVKRLVAFLAIGGIVSQVTGMSNCPTICGGTKCEKGEACIFISPVCAINLPCTPKESVCRTKVPCGPDTTECKLDCSILHEYRCALITPPGCNNRSQVCMPNMVCGK